MIKQIYSFWANYPQMVNLENQKAAQRPLFDVEFSLGE